MYNNSEERIIAYLTQKMSKDEQLAFEAEIQTDVELKKEYDMLRSIKALVYLKKEQASTNIEKMWKAAEKSNLKKRKIKIVVLFTFIVLISAMLAYQFSNKHLPVQAKITPETSTKEDTILPQKPKDITQIVPPKKDNLPEKPVSPEITALILQEKTALTTLNEAQKALIMTQNNCISLKSACQEKEKALTKCYDEVGDSGFSGNPISQENVSSSNKLLEKVSPIQSEDENKITNNIKFIQQKIADLTTENTRLQKIAEMLAAQNKTYQQELEACLKRK